MNTDSSVNIFERYCENSGNRVTFTLRDGRTVQGFIGGFVQGHDLADEPFILRWHLVDEEDKNSLDFDALGNPLGTIVDQTDITSVHWD